MNKSHGFCAEGAGKLHVVDSCGAFNNAGGGFVVKGSRSELAAAPTCTENGNAPVEGAKQEPGRVVLRVP
jgi:hypothetical protein